ncbi:MAG: hypothetical protein SGPRY_013191, partial [Prymnesium sp.]
DDDDGDEVTQLTRKGRISSADLYHLGSVTSNRVHAVLAERARARTEADDEKKKRANDRAQQQSSKTAQLTELYQQVKDGITSHAAVKSLSRQEILAVLHCVDNARKKEHSKLKNKLEMMDCVVKLFPDLPSDGPVVPRSVGRVNGRGSGVGRLPQSPRSSRATRATTPKSTRTPSSGWSSSWMHVDMDARISCGLDGRVLTPRMTLGSLFLL